jgi:hypothetical protein
MQEPKLPENETEESESEILDFNKPSFKFIPPGIHDWIQRGYHLVCRSCDLEHGVYIGPDKLMVGKGKDNKPILKLRKDLGMD